MKPQLLEDFLNRFKSQAPHDIAFKQRALLVGGFGSVLALGFVGMALFLGPAEEIGPSLPNTQEQAQVASFEGAGSGVPTNEVWARRVYDQSEKMKQEKKDLEDKFKLMEEKQKLFEAMLKNFHGQPVSFKEEETPQEKSEPQKEEEGQEVRPASFPSQTNLNHQPPQAYATQEGEGRQENFKNIGVIKAKGTREESTLVEGTLPAGSRVQGVMLSGLAVSTAVSSQSDPQPVIIRLRSDFLMPRGFKAPLKDAVVIGKCHGDRSSERAFCLLETISYVEASGEIVESPIEGWIFGEDGRYGLRGVIVDRTGPLIRESFLAGLMSGMANFFQASQTSGVNALKSFADGHHEHGAGLNAAQMLKAGGGAGVGNALDRLAQFAIDRAEKLSEVLLINPGRSVDIVLKGGFNMKNSIYRKTREMMARPARHQFALEHATRQSKDVMTRSDLK